MSSRPLLTGHQEYVDDNHAELIEENRQLRIKIKQIDEALRLERIKEEAAQAGAKELRKILSPLKRALDAVFGEMNAMDVDLSDSPASNAKWDFWKKRYRGRIAETIDLLLIQRSMNSSQLTAALKCDPRTLAKSVIYPLNSAGLLIKNGNMFSLKEL